MFVTCNKCNQKFSLSEDKVLGKAIKFLCNKCGNEIFVDSAIKKSSGAFETPSSSITTEPKKSSDSFDETPSPSTTEPKKSSGSFKAPSPSTTEPKKSSGSFKAPSPSTAEPKKSSGSFKALSPSTTEPKKSSGSFKIETDLSKTLNKNSGSFNIKTSGFRTVAKSNPSINLKDKKTDFSKSNTGKIAIPVREQKKELINEIVTSESLELHDEMTLMETQISSQDFMDSFINKYNDEDKNKSKSKKTWFVGIGNKPVGPLSLEELKSNVEFGVVTEESLVWKDGYSDWVLFKNVMELAHLLRKEQLEKDNIFGKVKQKSIEPVTDKTIHEESAEQKKDEELFKGFDRGDLGRVSYNPEEMDIKDDLEKLVNPFPNESILEPSKDVELKIDDGIIDKQKTEEPFMQQLHSDGLPSVAVMSGGISPSMVPIIVKKVKLWAYITATAIFFALTIGVLISLYFKGYIGKHNNDNISKIESKNIDKIKKQDNTNNQTKIEESNSVAKIELAEITIDNINEQAKGKQDNKNTKKVIGNKETKGSNNDAKNSILKQMAAFDEEVGPNSSLLNRNNKNSTGGRGSGLDSDQIRSVVNQNKVTIQKCYERELRKMPAQSSDIRVQITFKVMPSGRVNRVNVGSSVNISDSLTECIEVSIKRWVFPGASGETDVSFPVILTKG